MFLLKISCKPCRTECYLHHCKVENTKRWKFIKLCVLQQTVDKLDRGGLIRVTEEVVFFFCQMEGRSWSVVNKTFLNANWRANIWDILTSKLVNSIPLQTLWERITADTDPATRTLILDRLFNNFVQLRINA